MCIVGKHRPLSVLGTWRSQQCHRGDSVPHLRQRAGFRKLFIDFQVKALLIWVCFRFYRSYAFGQLFSQPSGFALPLSCKESAPVKTGSLSPDGFQLYTLAHRGERSHVGPPDPRRLFFWSCSPPSHFLKSA